MEIRITALAGQGDFGPIHGLPLGGTVPEGTTRTFTLQHTSDFDRVKLKLDAAETAGQITYWVDASVGDEGKVHKRTLRVQVADLTEAAVSQTIVDPIGAFPAGARLLNFRKNIAAAFTGGGATSCTNDVGFNGATDELDDGQDLFGGTGESFGAGGNAAPRNPRDLEGLTLQATLTADVNVDLLTAGDVTYEVFYTVHGS